MTDTNPTLLDLVKRRHRDMITNVAHIISLKDAEMDFWRIFAGGKHYWRIGAEFYLNRFGPQIQGFAYHMRTPDTRASLMAKRKELL